MQVAANGRDVRIQTFAHGKRFLHQLESGAFIFGEGKDASVVQSLEQVSDFEPHVQAQVASWLKRGGYEQGLQEKQEKDLVDHAGYVPGKLEAAIMAKGGTALAGQILALLNGKMPSGALVTDPTQRVFKASKGNAEVITADGDEKPIYSPETQNYLNARELRLDGMESPDLGDDVPDFDQGAQEIERENSAVKASPAAQPAPASEIMLALQGIAQQMGDIAKRVSDLETKKVPTKKASAKKKAPAKKVAHPKPEV